MKRMAALFALLSMVIVAMALAATVSAGGGDLLTVKNFPDYAVAGKPIQLIFKVWVPSLEPLEGVRPAVHVTDARGREIRVAARPTGKPDHYSATLTLPEAGDWVLVFDTEYENWATMPPLKVIAPGTPPPPALPLDVQGRRLFTIKGCNGCHIHLDVNAGRDYGPDLTELKLSAAYLRTFLADPSIRKAPAIVCSRNGTGCGSPYDMPSLDLQKPEIEALVAFLTKK